MFNVGGGEFMLIALVALLVLGPDKLPDFARKSARVLGQLRSMSQGFQDEMRGVMNLDDAGTPQTNPGPRLVGPTAEPSSEPSASDPTGTVPSDAPGADQPASSVDSASSAGPDHGDEGNTSGTSAA